MKILLARIQIENNQMVVELNSRERVRAFKRQLKKLLPDDSYRLIDTRIETVEEHFDRRDLQESSEPESDVDTNVDLANDPEIKETMRKHFEAHYMKWITDKIPALNNARPIDLVRTKKGRELVESMISSFEFRLMQRPIPNCSPEIFKKMRERLGL